MTPRETVAAKAIRYIAEGRLTIRERAGERVVATCRGGGRVYVLGHDPDAGGWYCSCPARRDCARLVALRMVTVRSRPDYAAMGRELAEVRP